MNEFDRLARPIQKWIRGRNWTALRPIQAEAINAIFGSEADLIIAAGTAGGKTEAAFLPLISQVLQSPSESGFDLVYIGPLKALITDQARRMEDICQHASLAITPWHGDVSASIKARARKKPKGILLITPESLEAMFIRNGLQVPVYFSQTRAIIIDELHSLLDNERGVHLRSLMNRMELAVGHPIRRLGLSATLGDMDLARTYLCPNKPEQVQLVEGQNDSSELLLQLRGYVQGSMQFPENKKTTDGCEWTRNENDTEQDEHAADRAIAEHIFEKMRGKRNLVFAGARNRVELYADLLRNKCDNEHLPQEFYAHHANLSRYERSFVEDRLSKGNCPTTAICTSTLELGIDIGDVNCVGQIGAPFTVASLRQRLGRSGRRAGQPAILRQYAIEDYLSPGSHIADRLRLNLLRAIAMIELLLNRWCEPPSQEALHLSTLVHQTLSIIAERGGASAKRLYITLCQKGPFRKVSPDLFGKLLRSLGDPEIGLIEQADGDLLLLGPKGEKLVEHYSFYAVFKTPEEYRLLHDGKEIGTLPVDMVLNKGSQLIFAGRRWEVIEIDITSRAILVIPSQSGTPPKFGGDPGLIDDKVVSKMRFVLADSFVPQYLDKTAVALLEEARSNYQSYRLDKSRLISQADGSHILSTWRGTVKTCSLALALQTLGFKTSLYDGMIEVSSNPDNLTIEDGLCQIADGRHNNMFSEDSNLMFEKFHPFLTEELLRLDALSNKLDQSALAPLAQEIIEDA
ncbi:DEAD/DEAH box helicase [uncultured Cohaesibacter sp.]|uniref:DEAD/DEAH box helicase n=1 Tax=uncultured Cohaesibacter sp. TaxID=1002546 RepID=UPI00292EBEA9|nr:DEAD/DEAH box helicase [uncultured Cohaesibacter sp.]